MMALTTQQKPLHAATEHGIRRPREWLAEVLTDQPVQWHPFLRVAALDAAFIKMCSHAIDSFGQFHDVVVNDFGTHGVSVDVICIEKVNGIPQINSPPYMTPICIFEPPNFVLRREDVEPPQGLEKFKFFADISELAQYLAENELLLAHARGMLHRFGKAPPGPDVDALLILVNVQLAVNEFDAAIRLLKFEPPA